MEPRTSEQERARRHEASRNDPWPALPRHTYSNELASRVIRFLTPWRFKEYRGIKKTITEIIGDYTWTSLQDWRSGRRRLPLVVAEKFLAALEARKSVLDQLVNELREYRDKLASETRQPSGFEVVRDRDGSGIPKDGRPARKP